MNHLHRHHRLPGWILDRKELELVGTDLPSEPNQRRKLQPNQLEMLEQQLFAPSRMLDQDLGAS